MLERGVDAREAESVEKSYSFDVEKTANIDLAAVEDETLSEHNE